MEDELRVQKQCKNDLLVIVRQMEELLSNYAERIKDVHPDATKRLTVFGGADLTDNYLVVGTRVQGDTMTRPFVIVGATTGQEVEQDLMNPGYAMVGALQDAQGNLTSLGER